MMGRWSSPRWSSPRCALTAMRLPPPKLQPWNVTRRHGEGVFRVFDVSRVELEDGRGVSRGEGFVLRCSGWCNVIAVTADNHILFVWQYRFGTEALSLEIPGGVVEPGEPPVDAAMRELREETGYEAQVVDELLTIEPNPAIQNNRCITFVARGARQTAAPTFDAQEELEVVLVPGACLEQLLDGGQIMHALVRGPLEAYLRKFHGHR